METLQTNQSPVIYLLSDSIGETGEMVVKEAMSQFEGAAVKVHSKNYVKSMEEIKIVLKKAAQSNGAIMYTLLRPDLKAFLETHAKALGLIHVDIMEPVIEALTRIPHLLPRRQPTLSRKIDKAYLSQSQAMEFAMKLDDGKEPSGLLEADVVVIGVSRVSKTPLCMYLALKGIKAANIPLVKDIMPPPELFQVPIHKVIGLIMKPSLLLEIRNERVRTMGLQQSTSYTDMESIIQELDYSKKIMRKIGCFVIDVSSQATEETAVQVLEIYNKRSI